VGELCEVLQWRGDDGAAPGLLGWSDKDRTALTEELADVLSYVLRIADVCDIDLPTAYADKLAKNRAKYPAELVRGSSAKYTEYRQGARAQSASEASAAAAAATTPPQPAVPLPSPSPPPLEEPFDDDAPYARAARRVEAQSRAYARAQKRAADKWAALQTQSRTDAMGSEKAMPASWADSGAAPASAYAGGRTGARTDEPSAVAVAQEASREESAVMSAAEAAEKEKEAEKEVQQVEKEAEMEVQQVEKEAEMAQRIQSLRERAISRAEAQWAARQARQARQASPVQEAGPEPMLSVESLGELWAMMEFDGPPTGREPL
jgi:NTP pyrophosphatase (non-canonical NTP hydrolase)